MGPGSRIAGNLIYGSPSQGTISPEARIGGSTQWEQLEPVEKPRRQEGISWLGQLVWFAAGVTVWGVMYLVFPGIWSGLSRIILQKPLPALGWENRIHIIFPFMIGYAGLILLGNIPVVGFFISVVALCLAMGAVFLSIGHLRQKPPVLTDI